MAIEYRSAVSLPDSECAENKKTLIDKASCAVQDFLREQSETAGILCVRYANRSVRSPGEIIQCSRHPDEAAALEWVRTSEPPPGQRLFDFVYGCRADFIEALPFF